MGNSEERIYLPQTTRRNLLRASVSSLGAAAAVACAPTATQPPAVPSQPPGPAWEDQWNKLVAAAKQEGAEALFLTGGAGATEVKQAFEERFPGVEVELTSLPSASLFLPRAFQERAAGLYTWDVATVQAPLALAPGTLRPQGAVDPLRPALFHPEVLDDHAWPGGFDNSWIDKEKRWGFGFAWQLRGEIWINTDLVPPSSLKSVKDLADPKWKGKMISIDPRTSGAAFIPATIMAMQFGNDLLKQIWVDQAPELSRDTRQVTEAMVKGKFAIAWGLTSAELKAFQEEGLGKNVKPIFLDASAPVIRGVYLMNRAPHPNAAKLFLNWFLAKEGQTAWAKNVLVNSRRTDVAPTDTELYVDPNKSYPVLLDTEETMNKPEEIVEYLKNVMKRHHGPAASAVAHLEASWAIHRSALPGSRTVILPELFPDSRFSPPWMDKRCFSSIWRARSSMNGNPRHRGDPIMATSFRRGTYCSDASLKTSAGR